MVMKVLVMWGDDIRHTTLHDDIRHITLHDDVGKGGRGKAGECECDKDNK